jgi:hypothetical protein
MLKILLAVLLGFGLFCELFWFGKVRPEAKREGLISDDYIENNEEDEDDE